MIYLDNSATTFPKPKELYDALDFANRNLAFNAGRGNYFEANEADKIIEKCRNTISNFAGKETRDVAFLSSATEALNLIINGLDLSAGDVVYVSPFEHNAIIRPLYLLRDNIGIEVIQMPFNKETWDIDLNRLEEMFAIKRPRAIFLSHISNVTGLVLPYQEIFSLSKNYNAITVLDAAQSYGVLNPKLDETDFCVFAGHKSLYASFGVAGIVSNRFGILKVIKSGGTGSDSLNFKMPESGHQRIESGSPNIVAIYGLLNSCEWLKKNNIKEHEEELTSYLLESLKQVKKAIVYRPEQKETFGIVSFNIEGYLSEEVSSILYDEYKIALRSGYHCSPLVHEFIDSLKFKGTVRVSVGAFNTKEDIDALIRALKTL